MVPAQRFSGMQKQVLGLYRGFLRVARLKKPEDRRRIELIVSTEFRNNATSVDRKDFLYIEYLLRRGHKQLELLRNSGTVGLSVVKGTADMVAIQFFWKNRHPRIQATASQLFGNPKIPCSRSNLCGELMKAIVFPTHAVEEAVNRVVNAGPDPEIALPMQVHTSRNWNGLNASTILTSIIIIFVLHYSPAFAWMGLDTGLGLCIIDLLGTCISSMRGSWRVASLSWLLIGLGYGFGLVCTSVLGLVPSSVLDSVICAGILWRYFVDNVGSKSSMIK